MRHEGPRKQQQQQQQPLRDRIDALFTHVAMQTRVHQQKHEKKEEEEEEEEKAQSDAAVESANVLRKCMVAKWLETMSLFYHSGVCVCVCVCVMVCVCDGVCVCV